jgi:uncharacterized membrane protein
MEEQNQTPPVMPPVTPPGGQPAQKNVGMAIVAYILFFVPLLTDAKNDPFVKYHIKQGLALFIAWIIVGVVAMVPAIYVLAWLLDLGLLALLVIGIMNALNGRQVPLPVIGQYAKNFNF